MDDTNYTYSVPKQKFERRALSTEEKYYKDTIGKLLLSEGLKIKSKEQVLLDEKHCAGVFDLQQNIYLPKSKRRDFL